MLYGIFDDKAGGGVVGNLCPACSVALRTGTYSRNCQGGENMAASTGCKEAP